MDHIAAENLKLACFIHLHLLRSIWYMHLWRFMSAFWPWPPRVLESYLEGVFDHELGAAKSVSLGAFLHFLNHILHFSPLLLSLRVVACHSVFAVVLSEIATQASIRSSLNRRQKSWDAMREASQLFWHLAKVVLDPEALRWRVKQSCSGALTIPGRLGWMPSRLRRRAKRDS